MNEHQESYWVDVNPDSGDEITEEQAMGAWVPVNDAKGTLWFPVAAPFADRLKRKPSSTLPSIDEVNQWLNQPQSTTPPGNECHLSIVPADERDHILARVQAALSAMNLFNS